MKKLKSQKKIMLRKWKWKLKDDSQAIFDVLSGRLQNSLPTAQSFQFFFKIWQLKMDRDDSSEQSYYLHRLESNNTDIFSEKNLIGNLHLQREYKANN